MVSYTAIMQAIQNMNEEREQAVSCVCCGGMRVVKNGMARNGRQRFLCRECGKSFTETTGSVIMYSHQSLHAWKRVIKDTFAGATLADTASAIGVSVNTALSMRHKVMHAIQRNAMDTGISFKGSNETAETYFLESFKGTRLDTAMKRAPRKRGTNGKRLVSAEDVCVCAVIGEENRCYAASVNKAIPTESDLEKVYGGRLSKDAVLLCLDERYAFLQKYCVVSRVAEVEKVSGLHGYMRMRVNAISHGVATKYLNRYMAAFSAAYGKDASAAASKVFSVITDRNGMFASNMDLRTKDLLVF